MDTARKIIRPKRQCGSRGGRKLFSPYAVYLGILPAILVFACMRVIPSIGTFLMSFTDMRQTPGAEWSWVGLSNYKEIFFQTNSRDIWMSIANTMKFTFIVTIVQVALALCFALILNQKNIRGRNFYRGVVYFPVILGITVCGLAFKLFFSIDGPAQAILKMFGKSSAFFGDWDLAIYLVIACQIWYNLGFSMNVFLSGLQNVSKDVLEAAQIDGANAWHQFWHVTFPEILPTVFVNLMVCVIGNLAEFNIILVTTSGTPQTSTLGMLIYSYAFSVGAMRSSSNAGRQGFAAALQMVLFVFVLFFTVILRKIQRKVEED